MKITKAVVPAAGFGTRFLPWTKSIPKEMLPLLSKPAIQVIAEEIRDSNLADCIIINAPYKQALVDYFKKSPDLERFLQEKNKASLLSELDALLQKVSFSYIYQDQAKGLGHAILLAESAINNEYFGIALPDDIMISNPPGLAQLIAVAQKYNASVIAVQEVPQEAISAYGVVAVSKQLDEHTFEITDMVEKPKPEDAPSNLAISGRYVLSPAIFDALKEVKPSLGGEILLTDGMLALLKEGERTLAYKIQGTRHDIGNPTGWLKANMHLAHLNGIKLYL
ncbi:MAG: UTP--glucose-1-phosphate uridylyltransferase [Candidatus Babeliales bacterium]